MLDRSGARHLRARGASIEPASILGKLASSLGEPASPLGARRSGLERAKIDSGRPSDPSSLLFGEISSKLVDLWCPCNLENQAPMHARARFHVFPALALNRAFGLNLERLGRLLGSTWILLGASWSQLGRSGANLEATWALLGRIWALLGPT